MRRLTATIAVLVCLSAASLAGEPATDFGAAVRQFSAARYRLAQDLSSRLKLSLPSQADAFFRAAVTDQWESVSNAFNEVIQQAAYGTAIPELRNELWAPVHETMGIWEIWIGWKEDSSLLAMFHGLVLSSMPKGSIYFGGTEYGRFAITTINALQDPQPVFCITQNALADNTYAAHLRAIYGDKIWLPKEEDSAQAFQRYVQEVQAGKRPANAELKIENGRVQVSGALGVMEINGILCQMIFEHNKADHDFFVEESYVINWMYPYLEPHGLIMKLNRQILPSLPEETVACDREFWKRYEQRLEGTPSFAGNVEARKAFAKLRCAIAGIYAHRSMYAEAEEAFQQAIRLCPASPEASYRLADTHLRQGHTRKAVEAMRNFLKHVAPDQRDKAQEYTKQLEDRMQNNGTEPIR
jgi:tetratricopeptide (TPR) repeat protein